MGTIAGLPPVLVAFGLAATGASIIVVTLVATILRPSLRFWPPGERNWKYWLHWTCVGTFNLAGLVVAVLDFDTFRVPDWAQVVGGVVFVAGMVLGTVALRQLGGDRTTGLSGDLVTDGLYRYSRNPQYVGYIVATVGAVLLVNSALVVVLGTLHVVWQALLPIPEEPWLREAFGDTYESYASTVPRFVGRESVRRLLER